MTEPPKYDPKDRKAPTGESLNKTARAIRERTPKSSAEITVSEANDGVRFQLVLEPSIQQLFSPPIGPTSPQWPGWLPGTTAGLMSLLASAGDSLIGPNGWLLRAGTEQIGAETWPYTPAQWITGATTPTTPPPEGDDYKAEWALSAIVSGGVVEGTVGETWGAGDWETAVLAGRFRPALLVLLECYAVITQDNVWENISGFYCLTERPSGKTAKVKVGDEWIEWFCAEADSARMECTATVDLEPSAAEHWQTHQQTVAVPAEMLAHCEPSTIQAVTAHSPGIIATADVKGAHCEVLAATPPGHRGSVAVTVRLSGVRRGMPQIWPRTCFKVAARNARHYHEAQ